MTAWHKALLKTTAHAPVLGFQVDCMHSEGGVLPIEPWYAQRIDNSCHLSAYDQDFGYTKTAFLRLVKSLGWTYDREGNWICPECSKNNNKPTTQGE